MSGKPNIICYDQVRFVVCEDRHIHMEIGMDDNTFVEFIMENVDMALLFKKELDKAIDAALAD